MDELRRTISFSEGFAIAVSMVVGTGLLGLPGQAIENTDHVTALYAWLVVVCVVAPFIHIFSHLGARYPSASGIVGFAADGLGAWSGPGATLIACGALAIGMPALFVVGGAFAAELFSVNCDGCRMWLAIAIAAVTTGLNVSGVRNTALVNRAVVGIIAVFTAGVVAVKLPSLADESSLLIQDIAHEPPTASGIALAGTLIFWAFQGWENLSFGFGDFKSPKRTIPQVYWTSFAAVSTVYLLFAWVVSAVTYDAQLVTGLAGVSVLLGSGPLKTAALLMLLLLLIVNANSWVFGASRLFYSAAKASLLPRRLAKLNSRNTPAACLMASGISYCTAIALIESMRINIRAAFMLTSAAFIVLYAICVAAYLACNRKSYRSAACTMVAAAGLLFLMQALKWYLLYPVILFVLGTAIHTRAKSGKYSTADKLSVEA